MTPSMRTTGGVVSQGRSRKWLVRTDLFGVVLRRCGCCTLVLHSGGLTLKCQLVQAHSSGGGRPVVLLAALTIAEHGDWSPSGPWLPRLPKTVSLIGDSRNGTAPVVKSTAFVSEPKDAPGVGELDAHQIYVIVAFLGHVADALGQLVIPALAWWDHPDSVNRGVALLSGPWTAVMWIVYP